LAEDAVHEDDQIDRQIEIVEAFDDLLARPRDQVLREEHA
jgi:hypothetical protein